VFTINDVTCDGFGARVVRAESPADVAATFRVKGRRMYEGHGTSWAGRTINQALRDAECGDTHLVPAAEALISQLECSVEAPRSTWAPSRAGAYPVVPEALAGFPDAMRRRVPAYDDRSPLRVVIDLTSSAAISHEALEKRGTAYLALAMFLSNERPVTLEAVTGLGGYGQTACFLVTTIPAQPLDLAVACSALTSAGFSRLLGYDLIHVLGKHISGSWPWSVQPFGDAAATFVERERAVLGLGPDDILAPPAHLRDPAVKDPVGFVRRAIEEHAARQEG
jgi:hypothetical protein